MSPQHLHSRCAPSPRRRPLSLLLLALVIGLPGCGRQGEDLVPVGGTVTVGGQPLTRGSVAFHPDRDHGNESDHLPTGTINADGRYRLAIGKRDGAPPGWYRVVVFAPEGEAAWQDGRPAVPRSLIHGRYTNPQTTDLLVEVRADAPSEVYDLNLEK
jgi:hypothetical protein